MITGDSSCGKSRILERFVSGNFGSSAPTIGVEFIPKLLLLPDGTRVRLQLWDTAGSERYRSMTVAHYRNALGAVLVYDVTSADSFYSCNYWLD